MRTKSGVPKRCAVESLSTYSASVVATTLYRAPARPIKTSATALSAIAAGLGTDIGDRALELMRTHNVPEYVMRALVHGTVAPEPEDGATKL